MSYPVQQPGYPVAPPAPQYPGQQGYPAQQPGYPVAPVPAPAGYAPLHPQQSYPPAPQYPAAPQGYPMQPQQGGYPGQQQGYLQAQQQVPVAATLADFYAQPATGWGPSITPIGTTPDGTAYTVVVAQWITKAHVEHKTKYQSTELDFYRDGRPKLVMKVPGYVAPGTQYTTAQGGMQQVLDGRAQLYIQGPDRDLLNAAMLRAGAPVEHGPELGSIIRMTKTHNKPNRSGTQSAVKAIEYWRPGAEAQAFAAQQGIEYPDLSTPRPVEDGAAPAAQQTSPAVAATAPAPVPQPPAPPASVAQPQYAAPAPPVPAQPAPAPVAYQQPAPVAQRPQPPAPAAPVAQLPPPPAPAPMPELAGDPANAALLAHLINQQAPAATS